MILSPASNPAVCAEYPSIVESISLDTNVPAVEVRPKYKHTAKTIFTIAPAKTIAILFGILALEKNPHFLIVLLLLPYLQIHQAVLIELHI